MGILLFLFLGVATFDQKMEDGSGKLSHLPKN